MNTDRSVIIGKYFLYENALNSKAYIFNEFVSLVRDKIRVEKYTFHVRLAVKKNTFYSVLKVFRYSFSETIPMFFNRLKSDFVLVRSLQTFRQ